MKSLEEEWDGKWRIVVFDIPESHRKERSVLRAHLKIWGFTPWQQSVWAVDKNVTKPLRDFVDEAGIQEWVKIIESEKVF